MLLNSLPLSESILHGGPKIAISAPAMPSFFFDVITAAALKLVA